MVGTLCDEEGLEEYLHHFAPAASFTINVDAFGSDTKTYIATGERRETFRCTNAEEVFMQCHNMPPPRLVSDSNWELESCDERIQVYSVDATPAHHRDPYVIITNSADEAWDASDMKGIKSIYALKGIRGSTEGK